MFIKDCVQSIHAKLLHTSSTPHLDAELIVCDVLYKDRAWLISHPEIKLTDANLKQIEYAAIRRSNGEPMAYITGKSEFFGREFIVSADTLQPRPETETMIEMLLSDLKDQGLKTIDNNPKNSELITIVDIGTGSGCLAITAQLEISKLKTQGSKLVATYASDISEKALKIAKQNAQKLGANINFFHGNLLEPLNSELRTQNSELYILANLPYVPTSHTINLSARHEPDIAIFGGEDGLDLYRELFRQIEDLRSKIEGISIYTESLPPQHNTLKDIAESFGFTEVRSQDLIQYFCSKHRMVR